jgi:hypothetical protein
MVTKDFTGETENIAQLSTLLNVTTRAEDETSFEPLSKEIIEK